MKLWTLSILLISLTGFSQSNMNCRDTTAVTFEPGPQWSRFQDFREAHLKFLADSMAKDVILVAGPFFEEDVLAGGLTVYAETDINKVKELAVGDALLKNSVVKATFKSWMMCTKPN